MKYVGYILLSVACACSSIVHAAYVYNAGALSPGDTLLFLDSTGNGGDTNSFDAVLREGTSKVGVILLHGRGERTSDGHVILPLRLDLHTKGYTTLSIDTPLPDPVINANPANYSNFQADAALGGTNYVFPELYSRVQAATDELQSRGIERAVLVGFSMGSRLGSAYMSFGAAGSIPIVGFIGVGMASDNMASLLDTPTSLAGISVPVLDLYGSLDNFTVLNSAANRAAAYAGPSYTQIEQAGTEHQWVDYEPQLISHVDRWMNVYAPVPEPETYAMLMLGLALVGWAKRRTAGSGVTQLAP
ncbi:MAG: PEP-CTERM sorting domain-containing protein [Burkholderiales bacterium]